MGQTKRKRRNKHRGNAVGVVEARGRTSKPSETARKAGATRSTRGVRAQPALKPPTLKSAALKAFVGIVILFIFFRFLGDGTTTAQALTMCAVAFVLYTPLMYWTDKWIYSRKLKQQQGGGAVPARGRR
jgi:hypothetical protein